MYSSARLLLTCYDTASSNKGAILVGLLWEFSCSERVVSLGYELVEVLTCAEAYLQPIPHWIIACQLLTQDPNKLERFPH